jgi:aminopeptidase-like protein
VRRIAGARFPPDQSADHSASFGPGAEPEVAGPYMGALINDLYPDCRSITGEGVRRTLRRIREDLPIELHEVPSGTQVLDWTVPREWNIRDGWIADESGRRILDFAACNLHVVGYSGPIRATIPLTELRAHLHSLPDRPSLVPYRTSYYREDWGFCLADEQLRTLAEGSYEVCIDASLEDGTLTYGELLIPGAEEDEVLLSSHICHPSLCNDNLSGIALLAALGRIIAGRRRRYTYRLLFIPGTIGSITWLAEHRDLVGRIRHGLVISGVGDRGRVSYKRSRRATAEVDRAMAAVLRNSERDHLLLDFDPYGYDERQFCSPGFNLPVGRISRSVHGSYPEYHTSGDNLDFITEASLCDSLSVVIEVLQLLEENHRYRNLSPYGEPQLGRRGLYRAIGGALDQRSAEMALLWMLNLSEGDHSVLDITERSGLPVAAILDAAATLHDHGLLELAEAGTEAARLNKGLYRAQEPGR